MADVISAELAATCAALGFNCGNNYRLQPHSLGKMTFHRSFSINNKNLAIINLTKLFHSLLS